MAAAAMHALGQGAQIESRFSPVVGAAHAKGVQRMLATQLHCAITSSAGRWFDAAAGALGLSVRQAHEAEAAIALQGLAVIVAGSIVFSVGLAPVYTLSTDLIVTNSRPEQAGTAGAVAETGAELGGALGIALLGSLGVTVYRTTMNGATEGLPPDAVIGAQRTLGDAVAVARSLPGPRGDELLRQARSAFEQAFATITGAASLAVLAALVGIILISRRGPKTSANQPAVRTGEPRPSR
jgi:hypothetical protein